MDIKISKIKAALFANDKFYVDEVDIFITDDIIKEVIPVSDVSEEAERKRKEFKPDYEIDGADRFAIPGLINAHTHAYMTLFRNMADDVPFTKWLFDTVSPLEDHMTPEESYYGTLLANAEMIRTGTTSYIDMHMMKDKNAEAVMQSGLRVCLTRGLVGGDRNDEGGLRRIKEALEERRCWDDGNRFNFMLAPHAPYTCGPDFLKYVAEIAKDNGLGINIHLAEGKTEIDNLRKDYNMTPIEYALNAGAFDVHAVAAHCVYLEDSDFDILKEKNVYVAVNPVSNLKLANGVSNVPKMLEKGINVCIGTDGAASNNTLNLFREMSFEAMLHKGLNHDAIAVTANQCLKMATVTGAGALGRDNELGLLKAGYKADITILNLKVPQLMPGNNLISAVCYSCNGSEVDTVIADGRILMEKKELKTIDEEKLYCEIGKIGERYNKLVNP